jgi:hypothetical protein
MITPETVSGLDPRLTVPAGTVIDSEPPVSVRVAVVVPADAGSAEPNTMIVTATPNNTERLPMRDPKNGIVRDPTVGPVDHLSARLAAILSESRTLPHIWERTPETMTYSENPVSLGGPRLRVPATTANRQHIHDPPGRNDRICR